MRFYLSSFKLGEKKDELARLMQDNRRIAYIPNAGDTINGDDEKKAARRRDDIADLEEIGLDAKLLDLREFFGKEGLLKEKLDGFGGVFAGGGNTFVLRQAMRLSGFDNAFSELLRRENFVYAGYSAGVCVLACDLRPLQMREPCPHPYEKLKESVWEGLCYLDYLIIPHYRSDHPQSADADKRVERCEREDIPFKTLKDGQVIIIG